jgi:hypothetical protein
MHLPVMPKNCANRHGRIARAEDARTDDGVE